MSVEKRLFAKPMNRRRIVFLMLILLLSGQLVRSQTLDPTITKLFQNSYKVVDAMRLPGGIYLDALAINAGAKPVALAANGVGLISLCIADAMYKRTGDAVNWDANAESKALQTINEWIRLKNTPGAVNVNGLFHRYLNPVDGSWVWVTEHSTIDNAIMASGFLFCKNYFSGNADIVAKTTELLNSMDFTASISGSQMYMVLDDNGVRSVPVNPFNEYLLLAWWAKNSNPAFAGYANAQTYWANNFSDATRLPKFNYPAGNPTLSENSTSGQPSFHVQFCYYYCHYFSSNTDYMTYFTNQMTADKTWWQNTTSQQVAWGLGAGEIPGGGYSADAVNRNPAKLVSPHIMAGFSPIDPEVRNDLIALYANGTGRAVYKIPGTDREFLWRYKYSIVGQTASYVQAVDFSTMLYGLAALPEYLGTEFFKTYNDFNYNPSASSIDLLEDNHYLVIYPNPVNGQTVIEFELRNKGIAKLEIYSETGQLVKQLVNQEMTAGKHSVAWKLRNEGKSQVSKGTYFCRLSMDGKAFQTKKMIVTE
jgi:hypothetical protein